MRNEIIHYETNRMKKIFLIICCICTTIHPKEEDDVGHIVEGNLALPSSQQPSPIFCFGQNIIGKGKLQALAFTDSLLGKRRNFTEVTPSALYGISDALSVIVSIPIAAQFKVNNK